MVHPTEKVIRKRMRNSGRQLLPFSYALLSKLKKGGGGAEQKAEPTPLAPPLRLSWPMTGPPYEAVGAQWWASLLWQGINSTSWYPCWLKKKGEKKGSSELVRAKQHLNVAAWLKRLCFTQNTIGFLWKPKPKELESTTQKEKEKLGWIFGLELR